MEQQPPVTSEPSGAPVSAPSGPPMAPPAPPPSAWVTAPVQQSRGGVTGLAKLGALVLVLFGLFWSLIGAALLVAGGLATSILEQMDLEGMDQGQLGDILGGAIAGFGIVILLIAIVEVLVGIFAWRGSGFARMLGILYGLGFGGITLLAALGSSQSAEVSAAGGGVATLAIAIAYLYVALVFIVRYRARA